MKKMFSVLLILTMVLSLNISAYAESYTVQSGDVLWKIAEQYDKTWQELAEKNQLKNPNLIYPGQKITISQDVNVANREKVERTNKDKVVALLKSIETGDMSAITYINPNKYIQHNLSAEDGLEGFGKLLSALPKGSAKVNVIRAFEDGDYVVTQTDYDFFGPKVGMDVFRFENGLIVEHWDNLTEKTEPNPSGHTQFDGESIITDLEKTEENKALATDFVETVLINGKYDQMSNYFNGDQYIQHNSGIGDGLSGLGKALSAMAEQGITMSYSNIHKVVGEGNFVFVMSEGTFGGAPYAYHDIFRIENGKIAEHWDVMSEIPNKEEWKNDNGKF
ncbi:nuclear transport factor 2 family protein [Lutibacter sp. B2]|nr:nuclear transport factor 2 family protein [Lutibacter sp. B2]